MAKQISAYDLSKTVEGYFKEFKAESEDALGMAIYSTAEIVTKKLRSAGSFGGSGKYKSDWKWEKEYKYNMPVARVFNKKHYRLTHLLEFGHAVKRGGRVVGSADDFPHIAPINDEVPKIFEDEFVDALDKVLSMTR